jgi:ribosome-associated heat shock protein Hsp15
MTRVDSWLWAVRVCSTRSDATALCRAGHVKIDGRAAKAASEVAPGNRVEVRVHGRDRVLEVVEVLQKRVGAPIAATAYIDRSPPPPPKDPWLAVAARDRGAGRPTKRERRQLERFRDPR